MNFPGFECVKGPLLELRIKSRKAQLTRSVAQTASAPWPRPHPTAAAQPARRSRQPGNGAGASQASGASSSRLIVCAASRQCAVSRSYWRLECEIRLSRTCNLHDNLLEL